MRLLLALAVVALLIVVWLPSTGAPRSTPRSPVDATPLAEPVEGEAQGAGKADGSTASPAPAVKEEEGPGEEKYCRVTIVSRRDGSPIAGAKVLGATDACYGVTGADGVVEVRGEAQSLRACAAGFCSRRFDEHARGCWVALQPAAPVAGKVFDAATEAPIRDARVSIRAADRDLGAEGAQTDAEGRFELPGPLWYPFELSVRADGYTPATVEGKLEGPVRGLNVALAAGGTLEGRVFGADGSPKERVSVELRAAGKGVPRVSDSTDKDGVYTILGVPLGVEMVPWTTGFSGEPVVFRSARDVQHRDIHYLAEVELVVTATRPSGEEIEIRSASLSNERRTMFLRSVESEGRGLSAPPGRYRLEVRALGWPDQVREIVLTSGVARETVVFRAGLAIEGSVVVPDGSPAKGTVDWYDGSTWGSSVVDERGHFRIDGLSSVPVRLDTRVWEDYTDVSLDDVVPGGPPVLLQVMPVARATGRLVWKGDGSLLNASAFWNASVSLEEDGRFNATAQDPSQPMLIAFHDGAAAYAVLSVPPLSPGEVRDVGEIDLTEGRTVGGRVVDPARSPVVGAAVGVVEHWAEDVAASRTDGTGRFALLRMPRSPLWVRVDADGWPPHFFRIEEDATELRLTSWGFAEGLGSAEIRPASLYAGKGTTIRPRRGPDGRFRARLQPGEYRGSIEVEGGRSKDLVPFTIREGETTFVEIRTR